MRTIKQIGSLYKERQKLYASDHARMRTFEQYINGEMSVDVAELDMNDKAAIANLARTGLEQMGLRVASTMPVPKCPPTRTTVETARQRAEKRRLAALGMWDDNDMPEVLTERAQAWFAHGLCPVAVFPDPQKKLMPTWRTFSPLCTFPAPTWNQRDIAPPDCIFESSTTWGWLKDRYGARPTGEGRSPYELKRSGDLKDDDPVTIIDYVDAYEIVTLATCRNIKGYDTQGALPEIELERIPNRTSRPLAFIPRNSLFGRPAGTFNGTIGAHQMRGRLLAIAYITARKGAMPEPWIEADGSGVEPEILRYPDPRTGEPGVVRGGRVKFESPDVGFMTSPMLSILEREIRLEGGIPAEFGGEAATGVRTGRRGDAILASTVDYPIQRAQRRLARSLALETQAGFHIIKEWNPEPKSFYCDWKGASGWVDYDPKIDFDSDEISVKYAHAGSDLNNETLRLQSKVGTGMISKESAREQDPEIDNAEQEHDRIISEQIDALFFESLAQKINAPESRWGPLEIAKLKKLVLSDKVELEEAVAQIEEGMQEEIEPPPDAVPGAMGAPESPIPEPPEGVANASRLRVLLGGLNERAA